MYNYFLTDYHFYCPNIEVEIYCQNQTGKDTVLVETLLFEDSWYFVESKFVLDGKLEEMQHLYKLLLQEGKVVDNNLDISVIKPSNINKIFVNDILFDVDATSLNELKYSGFTNQEIINIVYFAQIKCLKSSKYPYILYFIQHLSYILVIIFVKNAKITICNFLFFCYLIINIVYFLIFLLT